MFGGGPKKVGFGNVFAQPKVGAPPPGANAGGFAQPAFAPQPGAFAPQPGYAQPQPQATAPQPGVGKVAALAAGIKLPMGGGIKLPFGAPKLPAAAPQPVAVQPHPVAVQVVPDESPFDNPFDLDASAPPQPAQDAAAQQAAAQQAYYAQVAAQQAQQQDYYAQQQAAAQQQQEYYAQQQAAQQQAAAQQAAAQQAAAQQAAQQQAAAVQAAAQPKVSAGLPKVAILPKLPAGVKLAGPPRTMSLAGVGPAQPQPHANPSMPRASAAPVMVLAAGLKIPMMGPKFPAAGFAQPAPVAVQPVAAPQPVVQAYQPPVVAEAPPPEPPADDMPPPPPEDEPAPEAYSGQVVHSTSEASFDAYSQYGTHSGQTFYNPAQAQAAAPAPTINEPAQLSPPTVVSPRKSPRTPRTLASQIPDIGPLDDTAPPPTAPFQVNFLLPTGNSLSLTCNPEASVLEFLSDSMLDLLDHISNDDFMTSDLMAGNNVELIDNSSRLADSKYIRTCVFRNISPTVSIKAATTLDQFADLDEEPVAPTPAARQPVAAAPVAQPAAVVHAQPALSASGPQPMLAQSGSQPHIQPTNSAPQLPTAGMPANRLSMAPGSMVPMGSAHPPNAVRKSVFLPPNKAIQRVMNVDRLDRRRSVYVVQNYAAKVSPADSFSIQFYLPDQQTIELAVRGSDPIKHVKESLGQQAREKLNVDMGPMDKYLLKVPGASFLNDESASVKSLPYVVNCLKRNSYPQFIILEKIAPITKIIKKNSLEIGSLIGKSLSWAQQDDEVTSFRQSMTRERYFQRQRARERMQGVQTDIPIHISDQPCQAQKNGQTLIQLRLELQQVKKTVVALQTDTVDKFIKQNFEKYYAKALPTKSAGEFILKATGFAEYLHGSHLIHQFDYIRECILKNKPLDLSLVERSSVSTSNTNSPQPNADEDDGSLEDESFLLDDPVIHYDHQDIAISKKKWEDLQCISVWDLDRPFRFNIVGIENISPHTENFAALSNRANSCEDSGLYLYVTADMCEGGELLDGQRFYSAIVPCTPNPRFHDWIKSSIKMANLPRATRISFTLWAGKRPVVTPDQDLPLAWVNMQLFDYKNELRTGTQSVAMWLDDRANPIGTSVANSSEGKIPPVLYIELEQFHLPVVCPTEPLPIPAYPTPITMDNQESNHLAKIWNSDPLFRLSPNDKRLLWKYREFCKTQPKALPKFLQAVPKTDRLAVQEMHRLMKLWAPMEPLDALELLDSKFADAAIREYAVSRLEGLSSDDILDYLLQLVQVLKYEPYHDTALARFLLRRSLDSKAIGHHFFWYLKSEMHVPEISERYGLLLEAYLRGCGPHRVQLTKQDELQQRFVHCANHIKNFKDTDRLSILREELGKVQFPPAGVPIPLNPRIEVTGIKIDKCKYMDSKKLPLWLVFKNADPKGSDPFIIFKSGDDLRQDMLTLQMIRIMDKLWKKASLDLKLNPYGCISTGNEVGMIEVVLNAMTTAGITKTAGGAAAAFKEDPIANWLRENNPTDAAYRHAVEQFILSCAGYCVATYVLGIGDRHNDNVMCTRDGRLFHIDFGHFLGNFKKKFGVKRERAPFVFTPDFAYVMGGKDARDFNRFVELCQRAYNLLRKSSSLFINLFAMMLSTGIPELRTADDIEYLRDAFALDATDAQAADKFKDLIYESLYSRATQINNAIHILAH